MDGWIKLHRKILDNPIVCKDADYLAVWIYLLLNATHCEYTTLFKGKKIILKAGQLITGRKILAEKLGISESKIYRILNAFKNEHQIEQQTSNKNSLISIQNWSEYQDFEQQNETPMNNKRTTSEQQVNTNNNVNNGNNIKESNTKVLPKKSETPKKDINQFFEDVWKLYPKKRGKGQVSDSKKKLLFEIGFEELSRAIERYKSECKEIQYMQNGSTFFTSGYVDYLDENYSKLPSDKKPKQSFDQRSYDYSLLEKQMLERQRKELEERRKNERCN